MPLKLSFVVHKKDIVLDTVWWLGGKKKEDNETDLYIVRGLLLNTQLLGFGEIFSYHPEQLLVEGSTDTVYYSHHQITHIGYIKQKRADVSIPNPDFLIWKNKLTPPSQLSQALYSYLVPYAHPPLMLEQFTTDSVRLTLQVLTKDSLLVASKSEAFHASDPSYISSSDFALTSVIVQWQTLAGKNVRMRLPAKAKLKVLLSKVPNPESTKFYHYVHYINYQ